MVYAQTNLQLYSQMRAARYTEANLSLVRKAYDLATHLFTAKFRGSGKPLLSHLLGTASIVCAAGGSDKLIAASVLHAAYIFGDFGDGRAGISRAKRDIVRRAVGEQIEDLVARYHALEWRNATIEALYARVEPMSPIERDVLLVRLANELEDHLDLGVLYCGNAHDRLELIASSLHLCISLANRIDQPLLASELERVFSEVSSSAVQDDLRQPGDYTYTLPPASCIQKPSVSARRVLDRHPKAALLLHPRKLLELLLAKTDSETPANPEPRGVV